MSEQRPSFFGYLQVKRPADQRYSLIRSWRRRLVTIRLDESQDSERINVVEILLGKKQAFLASKNQDDQTNLPKKFAKITRDRFELRANNCVIYRCRSRKEAHAFVIANQTRPLLYLAASNEVLCQHWIKTIRDALWPPNAQEEALESGKRIFPVSLVDNEYSFRANLVGLYGYICYDPPHKLALRNSQDGTLKYTWALNTISMRLVGEAADQSFALIERVSLKNEHIFVEMNSDFLPGHLEKDENINRLKEQMCSDCNLILMNCSMDATTGPGLITFFSESAYELVEHFKQIKRTDLAELRRKQQLANENNILIEDLIADSHDQMDCDFDEINGKLNEKLNIMLYRKLSNALLGCTDDEYNTEDELDEAAKDHSTNLNDLTRDKILKSDNSLDDQTRCDHKLPICVSTSELSDDCLPSSFELIAEHSFDSERHSLDSSNVEECELNPQFEKPNQSKDETQELSSSSSD